jgi:hypothetical protein
MKNNMREFRQTLAVVLAIAFCFVGCTSDSTSPTAIPVVPVSPGVGSSFLYYAVTIDSTGRITYIDMDTLYGDTVLATGISQFGKTNVTQFTPNFLYQYVNYETNGDISYYVNPAAGQTGTWITVPLDSIGTRASVDPNPDISTWYSYTGQESLSLASTQFISESFNVYSDTTALGIQGIASIEWYDTTTGVLLEQNTLATRDSAGQFGTGSGYEIAKFNRK